METVKLRRLSNEVNITPGTASGWTIHSCAWSLNDVHGVHLIKARDHTVAIEYLALSVLENIRIDTADVRNTVQAVFSWSISSRRKLSEILNAKDLAIFQLSSCNDVNRTRDINHVHVLAEHGADGTRSGDDLVSRRDRCDQNFLHIILAVVGRSSARSRWRRRRIRGLPAQYGC